jgi:hypothetical protein
MVLDEADKKLIGGLDNADEKLGIEKAARSWEELKDQANRGNKRQAEKLRIIYQIRKMRKEYSRKSLCFRFYNSINTNNGRGRFDPSQPSPLTRKARMGPL